MLEHDIVDPAVLAERIDRLPIPPERTRDLREWLSNAVSAPGRARPDKDVEGPDI